ncbi:hypothetical protein ACEWY4_004297 [Coilia grayii]|uniref:R3H domain-containing protein n=1 Tax=Coilia grayii TaxID=363190 RepID=A0ABD1KM73_9TELE
MLFMEEEFAMTDHRKALRQALQDVFPQTPSSVSFTCCRPCGDGFGIVTTEFAPKGTGTGFWTFFKNLVYARSWANGRTVRHEFKVNSVHPNRIVKEDEWKYTVPSEQGDLVNISMGMCTCSAGSNGALCKHQHTVMQAFKLQESHHLPMTSFTAKMSFYEVVTAILPHVLLVSLGTLAFPGIDGCYLPKQENVFIHAVLDELDAYQQKDEQKSVLLFPPLPSRLRYLIHKSVESHLNLSTFSVGEGWCRRVVVCFSHLRIPAEEDSDTDSSAYEAPICRSHPPMESLAKPRRSCVRGGRRPDQAIYVPRALRERGGGHALQGGISSPSTDHTETESVSSSCSLSYSASEESCSDTTADSLPTPANRHAPLPDPLDQSPGQELFAQPSSSVSCPWPPVWDQTVSYFMGMSLDDQAEEEEEEEEDESTQSCSSVGAPPSSASNSRASDAEDFTQEIVAKLTEEDIFIEHAQGDYSAFENVWIDPEEFSHVIEIYAFPSMFKTDDLLDAFSDYSGGGMKIKWVDNTHALGVFSCEAAATQALSMRHPLLKTRPLSQASKQSKGKAIRRAEFIQPVKERPRTDTAVARRMVTRALGLQRGGLRGKRF